MPAWFLPPLPDLPQLVDRLVKQVPIGRLTTFGDIATALGDVKAARWVAEVLRESPSDSPLPVHRVVRQTGELPHGADGQRERLIVEGIPFLAKDRVAVEEVRWSAFVGPQPLRELCDWQNRMGAAAKLRPWTMIPVILGGVDLSYTSPNEAVAAYVSVDVASGQVRFQHTIRRPVSFPYIPGYLTFREAPVLLDLLADVRQLGALDPVVLVDGSGRLHPRRAGIAVALGLLADCATIGVAKHQLCGRVRADQSVEGCPTIEHGGETLGVRLDGGSKRRTLFVSPGHGFDLESAVRLTRAVWRTERLPLPTFHADRISRDAVRLLASGGT
jgi:deoxyribonuclease V